MGSMNHIGIISYIIVFVLYIFSLKSSAEIGKVNANKKHSIPDEIKVLGQFQYHFFTVWTFVSIYYKLLTFAVNVIIANSMTHINFSVIIVANLVFLMAHSNIRGLFHYNSQSLVSKWKNARNTNLEQVRSGISICLICNLTIVLKLNKISL